MVWQYEKFKGDGAVYAFCPKCNFRHNPSRKDFGTFELSISYQYNYCPIYGEYLYDADAEENGFEVTWDQRDITELYDER